MLHVTDFTAPGTRILEAIVSILKVVEGLAKLVLSSQNEGAIVCNGLIEGLPCE